MLNTMDWTINIVMNFTLDKLNGLCDDRFNNTIVQLVDIYCLSSYHVSDLLSSPVVTVFPSFQFDLSQFCQVNHFRMLSKRARSAPPTLAVGPSDQVTPIWDGAIALHPSSAPNTPPADHNPPAFLTTQTTVTPPTALPAPPPPTAAPAPPAPTTLSVPPAPTAVPVPPAPTAVPVLPAPVAPSTAVSGPPASSSAATTATALLGSQPTSSRSSRTRWTDSEKKDLEDAVQTCWRPSAPGGGEDQGLWIRVEKHMRNVKGYDRTPTAYRIKYGRDHRRPTGFDERHLKRIRNRELQTSVQKIKKRSGSKKDKKRNADEDDSSSPPMKKARRQGPAQSSSPRNAPAANSSIIDHLASNILNSRSNFLYANPPPVAFEDASRVPTVNHGNTYPEAPGMSRIPGVYNHRIIPPRSREPGSNATSSNVGVPSFPASDLYSALNFDFDNSLVPNPTNNTQPPDRRISRFPNSELYWTPFASNPELGNSSIPDSVNNTQAPRTRVSSFQNQEHHWTYDAFNFGNSSVHNSANNTQIPGPRVSSFQNPERYDALSFGNSLFPNSVNDTQIPRPIDSRFQNPERYDALSFGNSLFPDSVNNTHIPAPRVSNFQNHQRYDALGFGNSLFPDSVDNTQIPGGRVSSFQNQERYDPLGFANSSFTDSVNNTQIPVPRASYIRNPERYDAFSFGNSSLPDSDNNTQIPGPRVSSIRNSDLYDAINFDFDNSSVPEPTSHIPSSDIRMTRIPAGEPHSIPHEINLGLSDLSAPEPANNVPPLDLGVSSIPNSIPYDVNLRPSNSSVLQPPNNTPPLDFGVFSMSNSDSHSIPDDLNLGTRNSSVPEAPNNTSIPEIGVSGIPAFDRSSIPDDINLGLSNSSVPEPASNFPTLDFGTSRSSNLDFNNLSVPGSPNGLDNLNSEDPNSQAPEQPNIPSTPSQLTGHPNEHNQPASTQISEDGAPQDDTSGFWNNYFQQDAFPDPSSRGDLASGEVRNLLTEEDWYDRPLP